MSIEGIIMFSWMSVSASWYVNQQLNNVIVKGIAYIKPLCSGNYQCIAAHIGTTPPPLDCPLWPKSALGGDRRLMYNAGAGPGAALWRISAYLMAARWCRMSPPPADRLSNGTRLLRKVTEGHRQATEACWETGSRSPTATGALTAAAHRVIWLRILTVAGVAAAMCSVVSVV